MIIWYIIDTSYSYILGKASRRLKMSVGGKGIDMEDDDSNVLYENVLIKRLTFWIEKRILLNENKYHNYARLGGKLPSPPRQFGEDSIVLPSANIFSHWVGFFATMLNAWTGPANSFSNTEWISRCRWMGLLTVSNFCETTTTLKCVSEFAGTLCIWDSLITSR